MPEHSDLDMQILEFIKRHEPTDLKSIVEGLPKISSAEFRVKQMCSSGHYTEARGINQHDFYIRQDVRTYQEGLLTKQEYLDSYQLTDSGRAVLQNYEYAKHKGRKELWLKNAWIPILVSLATNLVIDGTKWLLPQILERLSHIL